MARKKPKPPPDNPWTEAYIESLAESKDYVKEARKVLTKGGFGTVEARADGRGWWVECKGMTGTYQVSVRPDPVYGFVEECSCPSNKRPCKHTLALLLYLAAHPEKRIEPTAVRAAQSVDLDTLVRAAFASPLDDTPRLALADCVEELGQPARAALIRVQCESARLGSGSRFNALKAEEQKLLPAVLAEMGPVPAMMSTKFNRGFATLGLSGWNWPAPDALPARFTELFRDGWIEEVFIAYGHEIPPWIVALFRQVREVDFSKAQLRDRDLVMIASDLRPGQAGARLQSVLVPAAFRDRYRELTEAAASGAAFGPQLDTAPVAAFPGQDEQSRVSHSLANLNPAQFALLVRAGHLRGARVLNLSGEIGDEGVRLLLAASGLSELTHLYLTNSGISPDGVRELTALAGQLRCLQVAGSPLGEAGVAALGDARWQRLDVLRLTAIGLTDAGAEALAKGTFPALSWLDLDDNALTAAGARALMGERGLRANRWGLSGNPIPAGEWGPLALGAARRAGVTVHFAGAVVERSHARDKPDEIHLRIIGSNAPLPGLFDTWAACPHPVTRLVLSKVRFDATEVTRLAAALSARPVRELHISGCELRNEAVVPLANRLAEMALDVLDLADNEIGKAGAEAVAVSPGLATVRVLLLSRNPLRSSGVDAIVGSPHLTALERIALPGKEVPAARQAAIRTHFGKKVVVEF
jgi:uncharacterized protein (TIGR02996 family)